jgi:hypothetical protein
MATLSQADKQNLNADQQAAVLKAKQDWEAANAAGDTAAMEKAHAAATSVEKRLKEEFGQDTHVGIHMEPLKKQQPIEL